MQLSSILTSAFVYKQENISSPSNSARAFILV